MLSRTSTLIALLLLSLSSLTAQTRTITDGDLNENATYTWSSDTTYILDGLVYLEDGGELNIEAGTVIQALTSPSNGDNTSALIITRDAQIFAEGTADAPIIFTVSGDDVTDPDDFTIDDRGLWGGLIILGDATVARPGGETGIEGIDAAETRARYGGTEDDDNSGVLKYVSIRHGGTALTSNNEINGLTLGGVGSGTEIDFIEVFANFDDGIEFFGGTVNVKHASVAFCGDDGIDYDFGYRGNGQFWFVIQEADNPDGTGRAGEHDGASPDNQAPFAQPNVYNATYIGVGTNATVSGGDAADGNRFLVLMRDNAGGFYSNSIFMEGNGSAIALEDRDDTADGDAFARFEAGDISYNDNYFHAFGAGDLFITVDADENTVPSSSGTFALAMSMSNTIGDPDLAGISRIPNGGLDPRINAGSDALGGATPSDDDFFNPVTYRGAFGNSNLWLDNWTALDQYGYLGDLVTPTSTTSDDCITITDDDLEEGGTYTWGSGNCYLLDGLVYLEQDGTLNIEAGTPVFFKGPNNVTTGDNTSALIIARDAQIFALGTAEDPIIFTAEDDDLSITDDLIIDDAGLWGGLIILGNATVARPGGETGIEGIDAAETRARFGGTDDMDNSGVLNYVSIRHGGTALTSNNEINGLTLGGVGAGTEIDYVEVFANFDDGIEFFGGTVDVKHAAVAFCGDDGIDYDFGYRGRGQYWFTLQDGTTLQGTGRAGEHDGANPDNQAPFAQPTIFNATYIGIGENAIAENGGDAADGLAFAILLRDNAGGFYNNSIFTDFNGVAIGIEDRDDTNDGDAFARLEAGDLAFNNNFFFGFGDGDTYDELFVAVDSDEEIVMSSSMTVADNFETNNNLIQDPVLQELADRDMLDPRPTPISPAATGAPAPADDFFDTVPYYGAFAPGNGLENPTWLENWTAIDEYGEVFQTVSVGAVERSGFLLDSPAPNPAANMTTVTMELPRTTRVNMTIVDLMGRQLQQVLLNELMIAGEQQVNINTANLANGTYFIMMEAEGARLVQKLMINQ